VPKHGEAGKRILSAQSPSSNSATSRRRSKAAIVLTAIYVLLALTVASLPLLAKEEESLAGIFFVVFALPWTIVLGRLTERLGVDSIVFNYVFLLLGVFVNAVLLYWIVTTLARWLSAKISAQD
jgi:hypothetical protein